MDITTDDLANLHLLADVAHPKLENAIWELDHEESRIVAEIRDYRQQRVISYIVRWHCVNVPHYNKYRTINGHNSSVESRKTLLKDAPKLIERYNKRGGPRTILYQVEKILAKRTRSRKGKNRTEYKVSWGRGSTTWEPEANLKKDGNVANLLNNFALMHRARTNIMRDFQIVKDFLKDGPKELGKRGRKGKG